MTFHSPTDDRPTVWSQEKVPGYVGFAGPTIPARALRARGGGGFSDKMSTAAVVVAEATKTEVDAAPISEVRPRRRARRSTKILVDSRRRRPPTDVPFLPPSPITGRQGARKSRGHHASHPRSGAHASRGDCLRSRRPRAGPHGFGQDARVPPSARARARGGGCIGPCDATPHAPGLPSAIVFLPHPRARCAVFAHAEAHVSAAGFRRRRARCRVAFPAAPPLAATSAAATGSQWRAELRARRVASKSFSTAAAANRRSSSRSSTKPTDCSTAAGRRGGGDATPWGRCLPMCLSADASRLARSPAAKTSAAITPRYPYTDAEVATSAAPWERLALTCHPDDAIRRFSPRWTRGVPSREARVRRAAESG